MARSRKSAEHARALQELKKKGFNPKREGQLSRLLDEVNQIKPDELPSFVRWPTLELPPPPGAPALFNRSNSVTQQRLRDLVIERQLRAKSPLKLYRPMPLQDEFHRSDTYVRLLLGSNRSGKTVGAAVEFARCVTNSDPFDKYPKAGLAYVVGKSLRHIGDTLYRKVYQPGLLKIVRNIAGEWEVYRPWDDQHKGLELKVVKSPPMIPARLIEEEAWENKAEREISMHRLSTGWEIRYFSSKSKLPQGNTADYVWFDEEIPDSPDGEWVPEMMARLLDNAGKIVWSASMQSGYDNLISLYENGESQLELYRSNPTVNPKPDIMIFDLKIDENKYQKKENVARFERGLTEEQRRVRVEGESAAAPLKMYPEFSLRRHGFPLDVPPPHWMRLSVTDPGHTIGATLFAVVPPLDESPGGLDTIILYDELYIPNCNAERFGEEFAAKVGDYKFEVFIGDGHGLRPTDVGSGLSVGDQYMAQLEARKVASRQSGSGFVYGSDDRKAGRLRVREFLGERMKGRPRLLIAVNPRDPGVSNLPNFVSEIKRYRKKKVGNVVLDEPEDRGPTHLMQCMRYLCMYDPKYIAPDYESNGYKAHVMLKKLEASITNRHGNATVNFGPG